jgi:hypothetical protein
VGSLPRPGVALAECQGVDQLLTSSSFQATRASFATAGQELSRTHGLFATLPELGYMTTAVEQELAIVRTLNAMVGIAQNSPRVSPTPLVYLQRISAVMDRLTYTLPADWASSVRSPKFQEAVLQRSSELRAAQAGSGTVKVVPMPGSTLVPFWAVELPYNFETGSLWTKKGREVSELALVSGTFLTDPSCLPPGRAASVVTDVFAAGSRAASLSGYYGRLSGRETKLGESGGLAGILEGAQKAGIAGKRAVPPLTTEAEALRLVQNYIEEARMANPKAADQLRASSPRVLELVYLPAELDGRPPVPWLGALSPMSLGDPRMLQGFAAWRCASPLSRQIDYDRARRPSEMGDVACLRCGRVRSSSSPICAECGTTATLPAPGFHSAGSVVRARGSDWIDSTWNDKPSPRPWRSTRGIRGVVVTVVGAVLLVSLWVVLAYVGGDFRSPPAPPQVVLKNDTKFPSSGEAGEVSFGFEAQHSGTLKGGFVTSNASVVVCLTTYPLFGPPGAPFQCPGNASYSSGLVQSGQVSVPVGAGMNWLTIIPSSATIQSGASWSVTWSPVLEIVPS